MKWVMRIGGGLLAMILVAAGILLIMGRRSNAGQAQASLEIAATPEKIWPWLTEDDKVKQWISSLVEIQPVPGTREGVGAKEVWVMRNENNPGRPMEITGTFTEYKPPERLTVSVSAPGFEGEQTYQVTPLGSGQSRLEIRGQYRFQPWFAKLMEPLIIPAAEKKLAGDLARLKTLVGEARAADPVHR